MLRIILSHLLLGPGLLFLFLGLPAVAFAMREVLARGIAPEPVDVIAMETLESPSCSSTL